MLLTIPYDMGRSHQSPSHQSPPPSEPFPSEQLPTAPIQPVVLPSESLPLDPLPSYHVSSDPPPVELLPCKPRSTKSSSVKPSTKDNITSLFGAIIKRKLSPEKEADTAQENPKSHRSDNHNS